MEIIGYYEEYYVGLKYIGKKNCSKQHNRAIGYAGKIKEIAKCKITFGKKCILKDQEYITIYYPLNGK